MTRTTTTAPTTPTAPAVTPACRRGRSAGRRVAAAGGAVLLAGLLGACGSSAGDADQAGGAGAGGQEMTVLQVPEDGPAQACAPVDAGVLGQRDLAVRATVVEEREGAVVLDVVEDFAGGAGEQVQVPQGEEDMPGEFAPFFEQGQEYLIAAQGDVVSTCGMSGPVSDELLTLYQDAFA